MRTLVLLVAMSVVPAWAETPEVARARVLYGEGRRAYDAGDYAKAVVAWKEGFALSDAPMFLFNIGQAYRFSGDCHRAREHYAKYRATAPAKLDELAEAEALCANQPAAPSIVVSPVVIANKPAPSSPGRARSIATWSLGGAGLVAVGVGLGFFGARSWSTWNEIDRLCGEDRHCDDPAKLTLARSYEADARSDGTKSTVLVGVGAAALVTATVLHLTKPRGVIVTPSIEAGAVSLTATRSF